MWSQSASYRGAAHSEGPGPRVVADLGGTHARFATVHPSGRELERIEVLACADFERVEDALAAYLGAHRIEAVAAICLAVAGPVDRDPVHLPNSHWELSRCRLESELDAPLLVINDFTAQALSIDLLRPDELTWFGVPRPTGTGIRTVIGPGTGLGVAMQMLSGEVIPSEGGHVAFAPTSDHEIDLLRALFSRFRRVSVERFVSGPGLENLYWANRKLAGTDPGVKPEGKSAREIAELAEAGDALAVRSVEDFFDLLASFAGDMALATWATGGVYLSGGALGKLMPFFDTERFRARFEDKGRFTRFCESVPIAWMRSEHPGLLGCLAALEAPLPQGARKTGSVAQDET